MIALAFAVIALQAQGTWEELGTSASGQGLSDFPGSAGTVALAFDPAGHPTVAWTDTATGGDVYLRRWDGFAWSAMDNLSVSTDSSSGIGVAIDAAGIATVIWQEADTSTNPALNKIVLRRWSGNGWVAIDPGIVNMGMTMSCVSPSMALDAQGRPVVAFAGSINGGNGDIYVQHWTGSAWAPYGTSTATGGISSTTDASVTPCLVLDAAQNPVVTWQESTAPGKVYLKRWDGANWAVLGPSASGSGINAAPSGAAAPFMSPNVVIDGTNTPVVCWRETYAIAGNSETFVRRWNGTAWLGLDGGTGNVSNTTYTSSFATMSTDPTGKPVIAWSDATGGNNDIYVRRWTGSTWGEMAASATGGGISWTPGSSSRPVVKLDRFGSVAVAWTDASPVTAQAYYRRYVPPPTPPSSPSSLAQLKFDGTTSVAVGTNGDRRGGVFRATAEDANFEAIRLQFEIRPLGTTFFDIPTATSAPGTNGSPLSVNPGPLEGGLSYHWQARSIDAGGMTSAWVPFGGNAETEADFVIAINHAPVATYVTQQQVLDGGLTRTLSVRAAMNDTDAEDEIRLEIEVRPMNQAFTGQATQMSAYLASGAPLAMDLQDLTEGAYRWRYQVRDIVGLASGWVGYGGNRDGDPDFEIAPFGSSGTSNCIACTTARPAWPAALLLLLAAGARRLL